MTRARHVLLMIDEAVFLAERAPVLFARLSRDGADCLRFVRVYDAAAAGVSMPWIFNGDAPAVRRRANKRRARNRIARAARKRNRP